MKDLENSGASTDATEGGGDVGAGVVFDDYVPLDVHGMSSWIQIGRYPIHGNELTDEDAHQIGYLLRYTLGHC